MLPKLIDIGPLPIHTYGLLLALALLASIELMARLANRRGMSRNQVWDFGFVVILAALVGAKLLLIVVDLDDYLRDPSRLFSLEFLQAAGVFYGGLFGAVVGTAFYLRKHPGLSFWTLADLAAPCIALGQSIGRLGCFAAGCDYGKPSDLPWSVTFTSEYASSNVGVPLNIPLHPSQLYEAGATLVLFVVLLRVYGKQRFQGQVFLLYLIGYGILRFALEFARGDGGRGLYFDGLISTSQIISILVIPFAITFYFRRNKIQKGRRGA